MTPSAKKATAGPGMKKKVVKPSPKISQEASKTVEAVGKVEEVSASAVVAVEPTKEEVKAAEVDEAMTEEKPSVPTMVPEPEGKGCRSSITSADDLSTILVRNFGIEQVGKSAHLSTAKPSAAAATNPIPASGQFSDPWSTDDSLLRDDLIVGDQKIAEAEERTRQRMMDVLESKIEWDLEAQREEEERMRITDLLGTQIRRWAVGRKRTLRALLSSLQVVL